MPDFPLDAPLHTLVCDAQPPAQEALVHAWADGSVDRLKFGDLSLASRALASRLSEAGIRRGMRVVIALPQCPLSPVAHLACSRVGAITVPLPPSLGADALAPRLAAAGPALAIVDAARAQAYREAAPDITLWQAEGRNLKTSRGVISISEAAQRQLAPRGTAPGDAPLSLFFTSGTVATPKAVLLPHRVIAARMAGFLRAHPGFAEREPAARRFWTPAEWSWIGGLHDSLFAPWAAGATVVSAQRTGHFDPEAAAALVETHGVTSVFLPPTALKLWRSRCARTPTLLSLHSAGESLAAPVLEWAASAFGAKVREVYGMTECAFVLVNDDGAPDVTGRAASGAEVIVADLATHEPVKPGATGEVRIRAGAPTMMLGYVSEGVVGLPLEGDFFRTGDSARLGDDGSIRVLGRLDDVIKTSGYRVSPGEIEAALLVHGAVAECAVVGIPDEARGQIVRAFVKVADGATAGESLVQALRDHVRTRLAPHMVPAEVVFVEELPTTINGKILRRSLRS